MSSYRKEPVHTINVLLDMHLDHLLFLKCIANKLLHVGQPATNKKDPTGT